MAELTKGDPAPDFEAQDGNGKTWRLSDLRGKKVILYFYPADDTPGCTAEACDFRDNMTILEHAGYVVLGVSPQDSDSHQRFAQKYQLNFPLLVDEDMRMAKAYGALREKVGMWNDVPLHVARSTFVIDENGGLEQAIYGVNARGHVDTLKGSIGV
ncbi:MAG: redoxin domain-containing protein [Actinobacteria bacterium]|nr:redoxin domain-containing protein [Actinomycetota bacterium]